MSKSYRPPDYAEYHFSLKEGAIAFLEGAFLVAVIGYFFYRSWFACVLLFPVFVLFMREKKKDMAKKRRQELSLQFKDLVLALSANVKAGYSIENALREAYRDVELLYGVDSPVCLEVRHMLRGLENNVILEKLLYDLGVRSRVPDIMQFADVFLIAKRSGGNLTEILEKTAGVIEQKTETDKEIQLMVGARKMEQKIMNMVPFLIIFYIGTTSRGFFDVLYYNPVGVTVMTVCLLFYGAAYLVSKRIVEIEV
ncbi:MAG: type II secretion system F family protein [Lachnospiraceae bacterium]|nr:type II secretion system F family protein [Lachnospiraceae bacterium]